jgi:thiol-disulfide isomerase/thioredoxin
LLLQGTASNRDAVGARVEVTGSDGRIRVRCVRAGEGFLGQSSRWLHAGLGKGGSVARLRVRWPSGTVQTFDEVERNRSYLLVEGAESLTRHEVTQPEPPRAEDIPTAVPEGGRGRLFLHHRVPLPALPITDNAGNPATIEPPAAGQAQLIVLWAEWCVPCHAELKILTESQKVLDRERIEVVALHPADSPSAGAAEKRLLSEIGFPHRSGTASAVTGEVLEQTVRNVLMMENPLPVPCSFLVAPDGWVAAVYLGETPLERIRADRSLLDATPSTRLAAATPFPGRWIRPENPAFHALYVPVTLLRHGQLETAANLLRTHESSFVQSPNCALVLGGVAERLLREGEGEGGIDFYRRSLKLDPDNAAAQNNLAWHLATHPDPSLRDGAEAVAWARRAMERSTNPAPGAYDTLAAAYAESGDFAQAVESARQGLLVAEKSGNDSAAERLRTVLELYRVGKPQRSDPAKSSISP